MKRRAREVKVEILSIALAAAALGVASLAPGCQRVAPVTEESGGAALMRNLVRARAVDVIVEAGPLEAVCQRWADEFRPPASSQPQLVRDNPPPGRDWLDIRINPPAGERRVAARIVVGTLALPGVAALLDRLGLDHGDLPEGHGFQYREQVFVGAGDTLIATFEDPERPGLPLTLFFGNSAAALPGVLGDLAPAWRPWLQCFRAGELALSGPLRLDGQIVAHELGRILRTYPLPLGHGPLPPEFDGIAGSAANDVPIERARDYLARASRARAKIAEFLSTSVIPPVDLTLYAYPEQMVPKVGNQRLSGVNPITRSAHVLCASGVPDDGGAAVAEACALQALGTPVHAWLLAGASVDAAGTYFGVDLERWIAWLATSGRKAEPTDPDWSTDRSPHARVPLQAALFRFLCESRGAAVVRQIWDGTIEFDEDDETRAQFKQFLDRRAASHAAVLRERRSAPIPRPASAPFAKGVAIQSSSSRLVTGYGSKLFETSLDELKVLGANTVSVTSYLVDEPDPPEFAGFLNRRTYGPVEGDVGLFCALWQARARGLATWLAPHLLSAPAGSYRAAWVREDRAAVSTFYERYAAFLEHYALLAELCGADLLCIGSQIPETTKVVSEGRRANPAAVEWKRTGWADVLSAARSVYGGRLTYAASTPEELNRIEFWSDLDAITFNLDPSLDPAYPGGPFAARGALALGLKRQLEDLDALCAARDRPLLLMDVTFDGDERRSRRTLAGVGAGPFYIAMHECTVFFDVLNGPARPSRLAGFTLWRWGVDPDDRGFRGTAVENVLRRALVR